VESTKKTQRRSSNLEITLCGFPREKNHIWANLRKDGLAHSKYNIVYPITLFFLKNNFEPNPVLVNINKLKPYKYVDKRVLGFRA
jgi:hypothetical protein